MKAIIISLILVLQVFSSQIETEKKIYKTILTALFPSKKIINVWSDDASKKTLFASMKQVRVVQDKKDADILMLYHAEDVNTTDKKVFANGYLVLQQVKSEAIGGFYWQKGRPNLVFFKKMLKKEDINLPANLRKYIEDNN